MGGRWSAGTEVFEMGDVGLYGGECRSLGEIGEGFTDTGCDVLWGKLSAAVDDELGGLDVGADGLG